MESGEYIADDGCRIRFDVSGTGPALLLIPGLGGAASFWSSVVPHLNDAFTVIAVDHRGAGRSDRPDGGYAIDTIASDTVGILERLGIAKAHVVGHSTGGVVAQSIALDRSDLVAGLVASGTWNRPDAQFRLLFEARLEVLLRAGPETYQRLTHALGFPADWLDANGEALEAAVRQAPISLAPLAVTAARIRMLLEHDRSDETPAIAAPTLVIGASDDAIIPLHHSERLAAAIPGARLKVMAGAHFFPRVHPRAYADAVRSFLKEVPCPLPDSTSR